MRLALVHGLLGLFAIINLVVSAPAHHVSALLDSTDPRTTNDTAYIALDQDQVHSIIQASFDQDRIITSDNLYEYIQANHDTNHTIYLNDTREFVSMSDVEPIVTGVQGRDMKLGPPLRVCHKYVKYSSRNVAVWWSEWKTATGCAWTGKDPAGGDQNMNWSYTFSITGSAGIEFTIIKDILSANIGVAITASWTQGGVLTCHIPGGSVGQVWIQIKVASADMWSEGCLNCNMWPGNGCGGKFGHDSQFETSVVAPLDDKKDNLNKQLGCSTGRDHVKC